MLRIAATLCVCVSGPARARAEAPAPVDSAGVEVRAVRSSLTAINLESPPTPMILADGVRAFSLADQLDADGARVVNESDRLPRLMIRGLTGSRVLLVGGIL